MGRDTLAEIPPGCIMLTGKNQCTYTECNYPFCIRKKRLDKHSKIVYNTPVKKRKVSQKIMANYMYFTGKVNWAKVLGDPVPNYAKDGKEWTFDFVPNDESLKEMIKNGLKDKIKGRGYNTGRTGQYADRDPFVRLVQKEFRTDGKRNDPIVVCDARNRIWDNDVKIGNESLAEVKVNVVDYGKGKPTGMYPQAIRILELVPYVRQEFAPLEEGNPYLDNFEDDGGAIVEENFPDDEGDPLLGE